jgi:teichuronic acid biosynthesis glycosyltransferase TuaC
MRVLAVTNMLPTPETPTAGTFVAEQIKGLRELGVEVDVILINRARNGMRTYVGMPSRLRQNMQRVRPDLIHVMYGGVMAAQVTRSSKGTPTVVTFHGSDLLGEHLSGPRRKFLAGLGVLASWKAAQQATRVIVVSAALRAALPRSIAAHKISVIPCGIDLNRFQPMDRQRCRALLGWDNATFHVLFPSNGGDPVKRPELAEAAVSILNRALGVRAQIQYLRGVPPEDVPIWLNASDVIIMTSRHEGSPTVIKEALACNLPVVSVDVGDVWERIQGIDGCHLAHNHPHDLAAKLLSVHSRKSNVRGRERVSELSIGRIAERLIAVYSDMLSDKGRLHAGVSELGEDIVG